MAVTAGTGGRLSALPQATGVSGFARDIAAIEESNLRQQQMEPDIGEATVKVFKDLDEMQRKRNLENLEAQRIQQGMMESQARLADLERKRILDQKVLQGKMVQGEEWKRLADLGKQYTDDNDLKALGLQDAQIKQVREAQTNLGNIPVSTDPLIAYDLYNKNKELTLSRLEEEKTRTEIDYKKSLTLTPEQIQAKQKAVTMEAEADFMRSKALIMKAQNDMAQLGKSNTPDGKKLAEVNRAQEAYEEALKGGDPVAIEKAKKNHQDLYNTHFVDVKERTLQTKGIGGIQEEKVVLVEVDKLAKTVKVRDPEKNETIVMSIDNFEEKVKNKEPITKEDDISNNQEVDTGLADVDSEQSSDEGKKKPLSNLNFGALAK